MSDKPTNPKSGMTGVGFVILLGAGGFILWRVIAAITGCGG
ncbi:MAG: hypothetical protein QNJ90_00510 [Planctomycetota bacterium]|nr:hypothetical protein [Planctomycetota bacterium]